MKRVPIVLSIALLILACGKTTTTTDSNKKESGTPETEEHYDIDTVLAFLDITSQSNKRTVIKQGDTSMGYWDVHTVLVDSSRILAVWVDGFGGNPDELAWSEDGATWTVEESPDAWSGLESSPNLFEITGKDGVKRYFIYSNVDGKMWMSYSEDSGKTWSTAERVRTTEGYTISEVMPFTSVLKLTNGKYLGVFNRRPSNNQKAPYNEVCACFSTDGKTWTTPVIIAPCTDTSYPCEPYLFRSPDGKQIACIMRENANFADAESAGNSKIIFSSSEGNSWTDPIDTPWGCTGDKHIVRYLPDGRLFIAMRDQALSSKTRYDYVAWVGKYDDLIHGGTGQYRIRMIHSYYGWRCGYSGVEVLADGTIIATTYARYKSSKDEPSIVSVRFKMSDIEK